MLKEFQEHIEYHFQELKKNTFLLACSGGVDSVVMAHLCANSQLDFAIAHCNFNLRGEESNADEAFVTQLAKELDKDFFVTSFNTNKYMADEKLSLQVAARELRYNWFKEIMHENSYAKLVTAHHADDNLETFIINLSRGTGIDGLTGIPAKTETIARPLLKFSREEILNYAENQQLTWREDKSNQDTKYLRNKIRHKLVPLLKELHPTFLDNFGMTQEYLQETSEILIAHIHQLKETLFIEENGIIKAEVSRLKALNPLKPYMHNLYKDYGFTQWEDILGLLSGMSGKEVFSKTHRLLRDREFLLLQELEETSDIVYKINESDTSVSQPLQMVITTADCVDEVAKNLLYADKEKLKFPLLLRKWKKGDELYPIGLGGKKKLSKYYKDEKMSLIAKEAQWLLCSGDAIVWVVGRRADDRFKVSSKTKSILKFTLK